MSDPINLIALVADQIAIDPKAHVYLLIDHAGLPGLKPKLEYARMEWVSLFDGTRESTAISVSPILVWIASGGTPLPRWFLDWVAQAGTYASAVIILTSPLSINALRGRLTKRLDITLSENMDAMLRFYDPRILAQLRITLTEEQAASFFCVATQWWYIGRAGVLEKFDGSYVPNDDSCIPLTLSQEQEFALLDASEADQVLSLLNQEVPNLMNAVPQSDRYATVIRNVAFAKNAGLHSIRDFLVYIIAVLSTNEDTVQNKFSSKESENDRKNSEIFRALMRG